MNEWNVFIDLQLKTISGRVVVKQVMLNCIDNSFKRFGGGWSSRKTIVGLLFLTSYFVFQGFLIPWYVPSIIPPWFPWPSNCVSLGMVLAIKAFQVVSSIQTTKDHLGTRMKYLQQNQKNSPSFPTVAPFTPKDLLLSGYSSQPSSTHGPAAELSHSSGDHT